MRRLVCALWLGVLLAAPAAAAPLDDLRADGWYTWRVAAADGAPAWCCFSRNGSTVSSNACNLDRLFGYGDCNDAALNGFVQVYARIETGEPVELRVLAPGCPVESEHGIADLGEIDAEASFRWLGKLVRPDSLVGEDALIAIAVHRGEGPRRFLVDKAQRGAEDDIRRSAMFWLAETGAGESEEVIMRALTRDPDREVRKQAVFALSRLPGERAVDALDTVLRDRDLDRELRESALFWLAQSGSDRALALVEQLLVGGNAGPR